MLFSVHRFFSAFFSLDKILKLSSLVGEVWVICCYLFLCGLLSLSFTDLGEWCALVDDGSSEPKHVAHIYKLNDNKLMC